MTFPFDYSILRYNHSQVLGESLNVGILFSFEHEHKLHFVAGNPQRVKAVYPEFDTSLFQSIVKNIKYKVAQRVNNDLFPEKYSFREFITRFLLPEDASALQFSDPYTAVNTLGSSERIIDEFSKIWLPEAELRKEEIRHNETFILRKFTDSIASKQINIDHRMSRNHIIQIKGVKLNFELSWKNGIVHLVKPVSFDLKEEREIQNKSATYFGYLNLLTEYAKRNDYQFDLLIAKPQDDKLTNSYDDALYNLDLSAAPKDIIPEERLEDYAIDTANYLHTKDL